MSAMPPFFLTTTLAGLVMWMADAPYPFTLLGAMIVIASVGGLLFSSAYVHAYMPLEWAGFTASVRRLFARSAPARTAVRTVR